jgi:hypothetical protein
MDNLAANSGLRGEKPVTNRLSCGTAQPTLNFIVIVMIFMHSLHNHCKVVVQTVERNI